MVLKLSHEVQQRFWAKVDKRPPHECWPWTASKTHDGYGRFQILENGKRRLAYAHRLVYRMYFQDDIPSADTLCVCHTCDNPSCCNPLHLFVGTRGDNNRDKSLKGRTYVGHKRKWLTPSQIREVRHLYRKGRYSQKELAEMYGVCSRTIMHIIHNRTRLRRSPVS